MTTITLPRAVVEQALEALGLWATGRDMDAVALNDLILRLEAALENQFNPDWDRTEALQESLREHMAEIHRLRTALAEPTIAKNATTQQQLDNKPPSDYRRGYWDGFAIGKREGRIEAEAALAEHDDEPTYCPTCGEEDGGTTCGMPDCGLRCGAGPVQEPYCYVYEYDSPHGLHREFYPREYNGMKPTRTVQVYAAPPQRKPLDDLAIADIYTKWDATPGTSMADFARAIERAHGIGGNDD